MANAKSIRAQSRVSVSPTTRETEETPAAEGAATRVCGQPTRHDDESPLAWLARRKDKAGRPLLSQIEVDAGERLRRDFTFAEMTPRITANWSLLQSAGGGRRGSPDHGAEVRDAVVAAQQRVRRALAAVGPDLAGVLIDVCCYLKGLERSEKESGWPQRSGKIVLQIALRQLARHYGIAPVVDSRATDRGDATGRRVQHWGTEDFRPKA